MKADEILNENALVPGQTVFVYLHAKSDQYAYMVRAGMWNDGLQYSDMPRKSAIFSSKEKAYMGLESWRQSAYKDVRYYKEELKRYPKRARSLKNYLAKAEKEALETEKELDNLRLAMIETKLSIIK